MRYHSPFELRDEALILAPKESDVGYFEEQHCQSFHAHSACPADDLLRLFLSEIEHVLVDHA